MSLFVVDVEADGPIPHDYSMVSFGAVRVDRSLATHYYAKVRPISDKWLPDALAISGHTREEHLTFDDPAEVMTTFGAWVEANNTEGRPIFVSDNNGFDWSWINWYFHHFVGKNPFGHSSRRIGDIYSGHVRNLRDTKGWKKFRTTKHTHHPVDDALGVAEAFLKISSGMKGAV
jgi:hypothetical protein